MKRLLCIVSGKMDAGGAETFLMKIYRNLDKSKYQMDFCVSSKEEGYYDKEIRKMNGNIYYSTPKSKGPIKSFNSIYKIVKKNEYKYVLRVSQNSIASIELLAAKLAGAKVLAFRSSNSKTMKGGYEDLIHFMFKPLLKIISNVKIAPSNYAAKFMFGNSKKINILKNGIPLNNFIYDNEAKNNIKNELGISEDTFVVGHIGRFNAQKNHKKIIEIFNEIIKNKPNSKLVLIGKGELESEVKKQVKQLGIEEKVLFLGIRNDVNKILSIFDVFLFPSFYEGMPNTVIEAQANGVPCVISNTITEEVKICDNVYMLDLENDNKNWCKKCLTSISRYTDNKNAVKLQKNGYDIKDVTDYFIKIIYERSINNK